MGRTIKAVYERGALRPLEPLELEEGKRVQIQIVTARQRAEDVLERAARVLDGLSPEDQAEVERIALDRSAWQRM